MVYYKMIRFSPVRSVVWIAEDELAKMLVPLSMTDMMAAAEAMMPGWTCMGYNVRDVIVEEF